MKDPKQHYREWKPGSQSHTHDETIVAVGVKCHDASQQLKDVLTWLGTPDLADGNPQAGYLVYYFNEHRESVAIFDVLKGQVTGFGTIARFANNALRPDGTTGFNILKDMKSFEDSEMR